MKFDEQSIELIDGALPETLAKLIDGISNELLIVSPWITSLAAEYIASQLTKAGPLSIYIISRMDERDFLSGSSHTAAFRPSTYPPNVKLSLRALPLLHGKMIIADRKKTIIGSANMTEGGFVRNHEISVFIKSAEFSKSSAETFFRLWEISSELPENYLNEIEEIIQKSLPNPDEIPRPETKKQELSPKKKSRSSFKYVQPQNAEIARSLLVNLIKSTTIPSSTPEDSGMAIDWLERKLKFMSATDRDNSDVISKLERLIYHPDAGVRATAVDKAGRTGNRIFVPRLISILSNPAEIPSVRSAAAFSLGLLGSVEAFATLSENLNGSSDINRWSRRSCFLLLPKVDVEAREWFFKNLNISQPDDVMTLINNCNVSEGTISERLCKALIVEKLAFGIWFAEEVDLLYFIVKKVSGEFETSKVQKKTLVQIIKYVSGIMKVASGDLKHGPLSPTFLYQFADFNTIDNGLKFIFKESYSKENEITTKYQEFFSTIDKLLKTVF